MRQASRPQRKPFFISMRWRFILPFAIIITVLGMFGAYMLATRVADGFAVAEDNVLLQSSQAVINRSGTLYTRQRSEAQRVAFTEGIAENIVANDVAALHDSLETLARTANLDSIIVTDPAGLEVAGVLRVLNSDPIDYSISTQFDLRSQPIVQSIVNDRTVGATGIIQTPQGLVLYVGVPIINDGSFAGVALAGQRLPTLLNNLRASAVAQLTLYDQSGNALYTTLPLDAATLDNLSISQETITQTLSADAPVIGITAPTSTRYRTLYTPFAYGDVLLGIIATLVPDNVPFVTSIGRQLSAIFAALLAGVTIFMTFVAVDRYAARLDQVRETATSLTHGLKDARTNMKASDEIGAVGAALDQFATVSQQREDQLRTQLWRQRRERNYMIAVFEAIPEGVIVQDRDGDVLMMNDSARELIGTQIGFQQDIASLYQQVPQILGHQLAPGIHALGDPRQLNHDGQMIRAQAAALTTHRQERIGTVMLLRDMTDDIRQQQARDTLLDQLSQDIQEPLSDMEQPQNESIRQFAREISRHAAALQKMIVDMRELTKYSPVQSRAFARPLLAETLIYALANDWRQIAQAAQLDLTVIIAEEGHYVLGDESRLRWALGNLVDNAIKYTPAGGQISIEIKTIEQGRLHMRIRDNGVGISTEDLKHIYTPFYRGTPMQADGTVIHAPGMGQGLPTAKHVFEAHGGLMKVKSRAGVGSAVYVALPITSGASYTLPLLDDADMEGETLILPDDVDIESVWKRR